MSEFNETTTMSLGDRMKMYERQLCTVVPKDNYFLVRLDGVSFSKFTKRFHKPFDNIFVMAMTITMQDLMNKFHPRTGYCHSDEITLIFDKCVDEQTYMYSGKIQKITSVIAGYCSVRFNYNLNILMHDETTYDVNFINLIKRYEQCFDARVMSFTELGEVTNHQIWRSVHDCERNAISTYAHNTFGHKAIMNKTCEQMKEMLLERDIDWSTIPLYLKHGIYCKKVLYNKELENGELCQRSKLVNKCFKIKYSDEMNDFLVGKYFTEVPDVEMFDLDIMET